MASNYHNISEQPKTDGRYMVKFRNPSLPIYDQVELAFRDFENGKWDYPTYSVGYELEGWFDN